MPVGHSENELFLFSKGFGYQIMYKINENWAYSALSGFEKLVLKIHTGK